MSKTPSLLLAQGYTMVTRNTRKMSPEWFRGNDLEEGRRLFEHQTEADEGRSRRLVAVCEDAEQAAAVVAIVSTLKAERDRAVALLRVLTNRYVANPGTKDQFVIGMSSTRKGDDLYTNWEDARAFLAEVDK